MYEGGSVKGSWRNGHNEPLGEQIVKYGFLSSGRALFATVLFAVALAMLGVLLFK